MSITIELNKKQLGRENELKLQYIPAKIDGDGATNVETFFNNYTRKENGYLVNALRGYPLQGTELAVPDGFTGVVLQETRKPLGADVDRKLRVSGTFKEFTYWNYDKIPTKADNYRQALQLLEVAEELAKPISLEDIQTEISKKKEENSSKENP